MKWEKKKKTHDQVVAVEHVHPVPGRVVRLDKHGLVAREPDDVLQPAGLVRQDVTVAAGPLEDLEVNQVDVDGVGPAAGPVLQLPDLDGAARGAR